MSRPIVTIDIDGTIAAYPEHLFDYYSFWSGNDAPDISNFRNGPMNEFLGMDKDYYDQMKYFYRKSQQKLTIPVIDGAVHMVNHIKNADAKVIICTSRPDILDVCKNTIDWLGKHEFDYDMILMSVNKYQQVREVANGDWLMAIEDDTEQAMSAIENGAENVLLPARAYNRANEKYTIPHCYKTKIKRVEGLYNIAHKVSRKVRKYNARNRDI